MAFSSPTETVTGAAGASSSVTLSSTPAEGSLIVAAVFISFNDTLPPISAPSGFSLDTYYEANYVVHAVYSKVSDGTETTLTWTNDEVGSDDIAVVVSVFPSAGGAAFVSPASKHGGTLDTDNIALGPITAQDGDLVYATHAARSSSTDTVSWTNSFAKLARSAYYTARGITGYKISSGGSESTTHTVSPAPISHAGMLLIYRESEVAPTLRKGSQFDAETTLSGTVTTATLAGVDVSDHITGQTGTTVSFDGGLTDEITTSGEYDLVLTDDSADPDETITVQVNVVGLPSNKLRKDGGILASLTDVEYIIMTGAAGSRAINQNDAGLTTDASGDTAVYEVTDTALNSGDSVFVVAYSDSEGAGIPFSTTLGLI